MPPVGREIRPGVRQISAAMLPDTVLECPHCGSKDFTIQGSYQRNFEQSYKESALQKDSLILSGQTIQEIEGLKCPSCGILTIIEDDMVFERDNLIFDLQTQIAVLQARVGVLPAKEWKN